MSEHKLTPWFKPSQKPVRVGVYERVPTRWTGSRAIFSRWYGRCWLLADRTPKGAAQSRFPSAEQNTPWRGVLKDGK